MKYIFIILYIMVQPLFAEVKRDKIDYNIKVMADTCFTCHTVQKNNKSCFGFSSIAGKNKSYLKSTLMIFKTDNNSSIDMHRYAKGYSNKEIAQLAIYISKVESK